jgi:hypothetical protein
VKKLPVRDRDYLTPQEARGDPPEHLSEEQKASWDALSFYDSVEGVRQQARQVPGIGKYIVRFDIPEGIGITWTPSLGPGHYDIRGDKETLKRCLTDEVFPMEDE